MSALVFPNYSSDYYRDRLNYSPHFLYYQRGYMMALAREKKPGAADRYLRTYLRNNAGRRGRIVPLLRGIFEAYSGRLKTAKKTWRRYWPHARAQYHHLVREYRVFKMGGELLLFLRTLSAAHPRDIRILKGLLVEEIRAGNVEKAVALISRMGRINRRYLGGMGRGIASHADSGPEREKWTKALTRHRKELGPVLYRTLHTWGEYRKAAAALLSLYNDRLIRASETVRLARSLARSGRNGLYLKVLHALPAGEIPDPDRLLLARILERRQPERALTLYRGLGNRAGALRGMGRIFLRRGNFTRALEVVRRINAPTTEDILLHAKCLTLLKRVKEAVTVLKKLKEPDRGIHTAVALYISGSSREEIRLPLLSGLRMLRGDGSALPGLELLYRLQFYELDRKQKALAAAALRMRWTERPVEAGENLEKLAATLKGRQAARVMLEAAALAVSSGALPVAERRYLSIIKKGKILQDRALYRLALLYRDRMNRKKEAQGLLMRLVANHPGSLYIYESRRALSEWK